MSIRNSWTILKTIASDWNDNHIASIAAALAYYMIFSLVPILLICILIAGIFFDRNAARDDILLQITNLVGAESADLIEKMLANKNQTITANILSALIVIFGASGIFSEIQSGLNTIWGVQPNPNKSFLGIIHDRFLSFIMVIGVAAIFLTSLILSAALALIAQHLPLLSKQISIIQPILGEVGYFFITSALFAMVFKILPDVKIAWRDVWFGAMITTLLFLIGKIFLTIYFNKMHIATAFGVASSLIALLIWIYYTAQIFFIGAIITKIWSNRHGHKIILRRGAIPICKENHA